MPVAMPAMVGDDDERRVIRECRVNRSDDLAYERINLGTCVVVIWGVPPALEVTRLIDRAIIQECEAGLARQQFLDELVGVRGLLLVRKLVFVAADAGSVGLLVAVAEWLPVVERARERGRLLSPKRCRDACPSPS